MTALPDMSQLRTAGSNRQDLLVRVVVIVVARSDWSEMSCWLLGDCLPPWLLHWLPGVRRHRLELLVAEVYVTWVDVLVTVA
jgi:hypothetical protein